MRVLSTLSCRSSTGGLRRSNTLLTALHLGQPVTKWNDSYSIYVFCGDYQWLAHMNWPLRRLLGLCCNTPSMSPYFLTVRVTPGLPFLRHMLKAVLWGGTGAVLSEDHPGVTTPPYFKDRLKHRHIIPHLWTVKLNWSEFGVNRSG